MKSNFLRMCEHGVVLGHPCVYCAAQEPDREKNRSFGEYVIDSITKQQQLIIDLSALVRRMSYQIKRDGTNDAMVKQSVEFLKKHNLGGSVLCEEGK